MTQDATIVRFPGDPSELVSRYAEGLRRFGAAQPTLRPDAIFLGKSAESPDALLVVLLWPPGVDHGTLGAFLLPQLAEIGLKRPQVEHIRVERVGFEAIAKGG